VKASGAKLCSFGTAMASACRFVLRRSVNAASQEAVVNEVKALDRYRSGVRAGLVVCAVQCILGTAAAFADPITISTGSGVQMVASLIGPTVGYTTCAGGTGTPAAGSAITVCSGSEAYTGAAAAAGLFGGATGILPFDSGIVLTTGSAALVPGPNTSDVAGVNNGLPGNSDLDPIANPGNFPGITTFDASVLEFSFIPTGTSVSFQYVFGSEEYTEFVGSPWNDAFAFFLNGVNVALVPGTTTPVSVNSIYGANIIDLTGSNPQYFGTSPSTQYDGLVGATAGFPLTASGAVNPGVVNSIRFMIADGADAEVDSGVFLAAGTFATNAPPPPPDDPDPPMTPVPEPSTMLLTGTGVLAVLRQAHKKFRR
jgi:hypothetical protein